MLKQITVQDKPHFVHCHESDIQNEMCASHDLYLVFNFFHCDYSIGTCKCQIYLLYF